MAEVDVVSQAQFWSPEFAYEHRTDGTILMRQVEALQDYLPTLADYLDKWADATPDVTWLARRVDEGDWGHITYAEARDSACAIGAGLLELGLGPDRPLLILSENSLEHALLGVACAYVGIPYAPVSPAYSLVSKDHAKLHEIVATLNPGALFADNGAAFAPALAAVAADDRTVINLYDALKGSITFNALTSTNLQAAYKARASLTPETVVKYLFTSGSTGSPKAVINTNKMICSCQAMVRDCYRFLMLQPPVVLDWGPWNHTASGNKVFYMVLTNGGTYYIDDGRPVPDRFGETLRNLREVSCTWYFNVPVGFDMLVEALETDELLTQRFYARLGMLFYAGAGMAQHTWDRLLAVGKKATGKDLLLATALGATETAPFALACTEHQQKAGNIGVPSRGLVLKLVPFEGKLEARLKGPTITPGYYGDPGKTRTVFDEEGYYCFGDALVPADPGDFSKGFYFAGRLAENFKLSTGTWVTVGAVRVALVDAMGGLIRDAVIVGENQSQLGALLLLSPAAEAMALTERKRVLGERLAMAVEAATGTASKVCRAVVLRHAPSFDRGEVTEKGSLNQRALRANNVELIQALYGKGDEVIVA